MPFTSISKFFALFLLLPAAACTPSDETPGLVGEWRGYSLTEGGDSLQLDPAEIRFTFDSLGNYTYAATIGYTEAGTYNLKDGFLYARDTTHQNTPEKIVAIDTLLADTLFLRMAVVTGRERLLRMVRE
ncbi:MAG: lipocalin family protein [Saprospiraceae bacterium]